MSIGEASISEFARKDPLMLKINTDLSALRRDASTSSAASKPTSAPAPSESPAGSQDAAEISDLHKAIALANQLASRSPLRDLASAQAVAQTLRQAIQTRTQEALSAHEGLSPERISTLLQ